jgi:hypothetical protein
MDVFYKVTQALLENKGFFECMPIKVAKSNSILGSEMQGSNSKFQGRLNIKDFWNSRIYLSLVTLVMVLYTSTILNRRYRICHAHALSKRQNS